MRHPWNRYATSRLLVDVRCTRVVIVFAVSPIHLVLIWVCRKKVGNPPQDPLVNGEFLQQTNGFLRDFSHPKI